MHNSHNVFPPVAGTVGGLENGVLLLLVLGAWYLFIRPRSSYRAFIPDSLTSVADGRHGGKEKRFRRAQALCKLLHGLSGGFLDHFRSENEPPVFKQSTRLKIRITSSDLVVSNYTHNIPTRSCNPELTS